MVEKDWYDELTKKYEFTVVQQPYQGQPEPIAARYLIDEAARLKADGWRPLTDTITAETTAIVLVREKRGRAN